MALKHEKIKLVIEASTIYCYNIGFGGFLPHEFYKFFIDRTKKQLKNYINKHK